MPPTTLDIGRWAKELANRMRLPQVEATPEDAAFLIELATKYPTALLNLLVASNAVMVSAAHQDSTMVAIAELSLALVLRDLGQEHPELRLKVLSWASRLTAPAEASQ